MSSIASKAKAKPKESEFRQYCRRKLLYNGPMLIDLCNQPGRFLILYYMSYSIAPPIISWLKYAYNYKSNKDNIPLIKLLTNPFGKLIVHSLKQIHKYFCPKIVSSYINFNVFNWNQFNYHIFYTFISFCGITTTFIYSYLYFRRSLNDQYLWPYIYNNMMNKEFTQIILNLLNNCPLNDNFHIDLTLKLYPIIKTNYFDKYNPNNMRNQYYNDNNNDNEYILSPSPMIPKQLIYELKIVQFTAANMAWYSTKWNRISIQREYHRVCGVFLCNYDVTMGDVERSKSKKEIRESIKNLYKTSLNDLNVLNKLNWCKNMCLTLKYKYSGDWAVIIGHRAQYRSFHSVMLENQNKNQLYDDNSLQQIQPPVIQQVPLQINNKTNAEFIHFGLGPKWFNWSAVVMKIQ